MDNFLSLGAEIRLYFYARPRPLGRKEGLVTVYFPIFPHNPHCLAIIRLAFIRLAFLRNEKGEARKPPPFVSVLSLYVIARLLRPLYAAFE